VVVVVVVVRSEGATACVVIYVPPEGAIRPPLAITARQGNSTCVGVGVGGGGGTIMEVEGGDDVAGVVAGTQSTHHKITTKFQPPTLLLLLT